MAGTDFDKVLSNVLVELASPEKSKQAAASAAVAMLLTQAPEGQSLSPSVVPAVLPLLSSENPLIQVKPCARPVVPFNQHPCVRLRLLQRNACAALIAVAELEAEALQIESHQWNQAVTTH